jgi:cytochrome c oxidase assembly protein subunit 15
VNSKPADAILLKRYLALTAGITFVLVWMGGMVTSKGYGLAVPDWPNTYGYNMFFFPPSKWIGGILFEHSHRLVASLVGFLTLILALWLHGRKARPVLRVGGILFIAAGLCAFWKFPTHGAENILTCVLGFVFFGASWVWPSGDGAPKWLRVMGIIALVAVVAQGVLGGLRVTQVDARIGIFHALLAQLFLTLMCTMAMSQTDFWRGLPLRTEADQRHFRMFFMAVTGLVFCQIALGAIIRHQHAGLAIPDFPAAYGKVWPDTSPAAVQRYNQERMSAVDYNAITAFQIDLQMWHRVVALLILLATGIGAWRAWRHLGRQHPLARMAAAWFGLVLVQAFLGAATIWTGKTADIATAHLACGALCLVTGGLTSMVSCRMLASSVAPSGATQKNEMTSLLASSSMSH